MYPSSARSNSIRVAPTEHVHATVTSVTSCIPSCDRLVWVLDGVRFGYLRPLFRTKQETQQRWVANDMFDLYIVKSFISIGIRSFVYYFSIISTTHMPLILFSYDKKLYRLKTVHYIAQCFEKLHSKSKKCR
jgi:hypothetical protein